MIGSSPSLGLVVPGMNSVALASDVEQAAPGQLMIAQDPYWGGREYMYCYAAGSIRQFGLVVITPTLTGGRIRYDVSEVPNTANLGRSLGVAMVGASAGQYIWVCIGGMVPVNCSAAVAANTTFGIAAAGQGGANAAGKQVLNARVILASTTTVVKAAQAPSGSTKLRLLSDDSGWFIGAYLSGTGIAAGATVVSIDPSGREVTISAATTAAVNGNVTATYNNATIFYNVAHINRPFAQGAIT